MPDGNGRRVWVILAFAAVALFWGLWHGLPNVYVPDTHIIRNALGMAQTKNLWPPAGTYSTYPYFLAYLLLPLYAATYFGGRVFGVYASAEDFGQRMTEDPTLLYMEARILVALFGLVAVYYLYRLARRMKLSETAASGAALLLALNPLFVQLGHHARPWVPVVAGCVFTLYHAAGMVLEDRKRDYVFAFAGAGVTFAMHQAGGVALLFPLAAHISARGRALFSAAEIKRFLLAMVLFAGAALLLGYGHKVWGGAGREVIRTDQAALEIGGQLLLLNAFSGQLAGKIAWAMFGYDPVLSLLGLAGLAYGIFFCPLFKGFRLSLSLFSAFMLAVFLLYNGSHIRYLLPVVPLLALGAAAGAGRLSQVLRVREIWILAPLILFSGIQTARMDLLLCRIDTRDLAKAWIEREIPKGARIAAEGYSPKLLPDQASLLYLKEEAGIPLERKERMILAGAWETQDAPAYHLIPLNRFYFFQSYWPHQWHRFDATGEERPIEEFLDDAAAEYLILSDRWPRKKRSLSKERSPMLDFVEERTELVQAFSPSRDGKPAEALLPMDMDFPLTALWCLDRPGPLIRLFEIKGKER